MGILHKIQQEQQELEIEKERLRILGIYQNYEGEDEVVTSTEALRIAKEQASLVTEKYYTMIPTLDKTIDGFRQGDVIVISGPTKMGKTTLAQSMTHGLAEQNIPCLWFSYEMTSQEFLEKFGEPIPYFLLPKRLKGNSLKWIEEKVIEGVAKYGAKVIFIDHLHYLLDMNSIGQKGNVSLFIGAIMRDLKKIALKWKVAIGIIAHTSKIRFDKAPDLNDIRDSSFISQEADTVLMIWRIKEMSGCYGDRASLAILANRRNGKVGNVILEMKNGRFREEQKDYDHSEPPYSATGEGGA